MTRLSLTARGHQRALCGAHTSADLARVETIVAERRADAVQYRGLDCSWRL